MKAKKQSQTENSQASSQTREDSQKSNLNKKSAHQEK